MLKRDYMLIIILIAITLNYNTLAEEQLTQHPKHQANISTSDEDSLYKAGITELDSSCFTEQVWPDGKDSISISNLFGTTVFIDELWYDREGKTCLSIDLPKTKTGQELLRQKFYDFNNLLKKYSFEELTNNYIFVPKYSSPNSLLACDLDISEKVDRQNFGKFAIRTSSKFKNIMAPNKNSLFHLLHCVVEGSYFLEKNGYYIHSLNLNSILHLGTRRDFLISHYSLKPPSPNTNTFSNEIEIFLNNILSMYSEFMKFIHRQEIEKQEAISVWENEIQTLKSTALLSNIYNHTEIITKLGKNIERKKEEIEKNYKTYQAYANNLVIPAIKEHLLTIVTKETATPAKIYSVYSSKIKPLIKTL
jgi:hypothetical protein